MTNRDDKIDSKCTSCPDHRAAETGFTPACNRAPDSTKHRTPLEKYRAHFGSDCPVLSGKVALNTKPPRTDDELKALVRDNLDKMVADYRAAGYENMLRKWGLPFRFGENIVSEAKRLDRKSLEAGTVTSLPKVKPVVKDTNAKHGEAGRKKMHSMSMEEKKQRHRYYEEHAAEMVEDLKTMRPTDVCKKWKVTPSALIRIREKAGLPVHRYTAPGAARRSESERIEALGQMVRREAKGFLHKDRPDNKRVAVMTIPPVPERRTVDAPMNRAV